MKYCDISITSSIEEPLLSNENMYYFHFLGDGTLFKKKHVSMPFKG
jgi:hypothetical protein